QVVPVPDLDDLDPDREGLPGGLVLAEPNLVAALCRTATRGRLGSASLSSWSCLARISPVICWDSPVTLPPGRAKLATSPTSTGSVAFTMTIGIVRVARWAASAAAWEEATRTATGCRT